ncbi:MAG: hypothetical protein ACI84R_002630 [Candidatus Azotimanducaceae bacterium]|jgi:hypothetical protein
MRTQPLASALPNPLSKRLSTHKRPHPRETNPNDVWLFNRGILDTYVPYLGFRT